MTLRPRRSRRAAVILADFAVVLLGAGVLIRPPSGPAMVEGVAHAQSSSCSQHCRGGGGGRARSLVDTGLRREPPGWADRRQTRTLVIGHRGASGYRPEHTLASYELAARMGGFHRA